MEISSVNMNKVDANKNLKEDVKKEAVQPSTEGYAEKTKAPADAELYKSMYGVKEQKSYAEQMAEFRAKYELDLDDKNREIERNRRKTENPDGEKQEKSFEEQYLEYKHKYE